MDGREIRCDVCGSELVWEHPQIKGLFLASSDYMEGCSTCLSCMAEYCCTTNCLGCSKGEYPSCRFLFLKGNVPE